MSVSDARVAIVTGAGQGTGGLGRAIAMRLAGMGLRLMVADVDPKVQHTAQEVRDASGGDALWFAGDLSDEAQVVRMVDQCVDRFGRIDVLVNNAGGGIIKPFLEHDAQSLATTLARNLWTAIWCCHKVLPHMVSRNHGRIVNIGADSLRTGIPDHAGYNAAKGGVVGMMVGLAKEFARYDITVNTVSPCVINTPRQIARRQSDPDYALAFERVVPKGRGAEIDEVVDLVCFLAGERAGFITGQDISVNGGSAMP
jgi:2,3-dihydroxy-2,3-dihydro-p-cumate dehydrogenase